MVRAFDVFEEYSQLGQGRLNGEIEFLNQISYQAEFVKAGGFANIHNVVSVNGNERRDLLLKIYHQDEHSAHAYSSIKQLHLKLKKHQLKSGVFTYQENPTLMGMPFVVFNSTDEITGGPVVGMVMYDLSQLGFFDYGDEEIRNDLVSEFDGILFSYQISRTIQFLHSLDFIHSDLKAASIFINPESKVLCLIDFDSGFHYKTQSKPSTKGSISGWIRKIGFLNKFIDLVGGSDSEGYEHFLHNEIWSLSAAIFQLLTGQNSPYSFLTTLDDSQKEKYIKKIGWPTYKTDSTLFNEKAQQSIAEIQEVIKTYEEAGLSGIEAALKTSFNEAFFDSAKAVKPKEWVSIFEGILPEFQLIPVVQSLGSDKTQIDFANENIVIRWEALKVDYVRIGKNVSLVDQNQFQISIPKEQEIEVIFHNFYSSFSQSIFIKANSRFPKIEFFRSDISVRKDESPVLLSWRVKDAYKININGVKGLHPSSGEFAVKPIIPTTFKLRCEGGFGEITEAEIFIDLIRPTIEEFSYEVNLDHGLENIDLKWKTKDALSIEITPGLGNVKSEGLEHILIKDETSFTIVAKGLFFSQSKIVKAKPFPLPIVKQLMVEFPKIELNTTINLTPLIVPDAMYRYAQIKFQNTVDVLPTEIKYFDGQINFNLKVPDLKCNYEKPSLAFPAKLTYKHLLNKVSKFLKFQSNE
jgi:serine/threonine protein kinase